MVKEWSENWSEKDWCDYNLDYIIDAYKDEKTFCNLHLKALRKDGWNGHFALVYFCYHDGKILTIHKSGSHSIEFLETFQTPKQAKEFIKSNPYKTLKEIEEF